MIICSFRDQLKTIGGHALDIRKHLDDGVSAFRGVKNDLKVESERFQKTCAGLNAHANGIQLRRDWLTFLGLIAIGAVIGIVMMTALKFR